MIDTSQALDVPDELYRNYTTDSCDGFAFDYLRDHPHAVVKVAEMEGGEAHCYVYDPEKELTIDPTLSQFRRLFEKFGDERFENIEDACFDGDQHPWVYEMWSEHTDRESFEDEYCGPYSPFVC